MSWLRSTSLTLARQLSRSLDPRTDYEPSACYQSFCKHWQQAHDIIIRSQPQHLHDDVLGVVNHLEQLATLLQLEARAREISSPNAASSSPPGAPPACLEHLLTQNLLHELYEWSACTGRYENAVRLEQLKLYALLVNFYSTQVLAAEPFLRPLLKLLSGFRNELPPPDVENQLVMVLNQLCVALMQNIRFIDLFFLTTHTHHGSHSEFIIVRLLLGSVHREGATGSAARDALLLCAKMSARCEPLAHYILNASNACPVLATGLSGLYSLLPRTLGEKVQRLQPDDVNQLHKLTLFIDSLEFCNATAQVAHPSIRKHLLDLLYQGFLVPVMGPALLQTRAATLQSGAPEQVAAVAYLELGLRCVTAQGLLRTILKFLMCYEYDGVRVMDVLLARLDGDSQLSLVTLALMETLVDLNCEDVMLELVYKCLLNGHHLMVSHRPRITDPEPYHEAAAAYLTLSPKCCSRPMSSTREWAESFLVNGRRILDNKTREEVGGRRQSNGIAEHSIAMNNLVQEVKVNYGNPNEILIGNYHSYLCDARFEIVTRSLACSKWSSKYDDVNIVPVNSNTILTVAAEFLNEHDNILNGNEIEVHQTSGKEQDSLISISTSGYETMKNDNINGDSFAKEQDSIVSVGNSGYEIKIETQNSGSAEKEHDSLTFLTDESNRFSKLDVCDTHNSDSSGKEHDSLTSLGESSGYESFRYRTEETEEQEEFAEDSFWKKSIAVESSINGYDSDVPNARNWKASAEFSIGPLLNSLLVKASSLLRADLSQNMRVTSLLSKLASFPTPLLSSLLLCPGFVLQPTVPSLFQILSKLKQQVDDLTCSAVNLEGLVDQARVFLVQRAVSRQHGSDQGPLNDVKVVQKAEESPFRRNESKRRSLSSSFSSMFGRKQSGASPTLTGSHTLTTSPSSVSSPSQKPNFTQEEYWNKSVTRRCILNAVVLDEWIKELSSLAQEHALRLSSGFYADDSLDRTMSL